MLIALPILNQGLFGVSLYVNLAYAELETLHVPPLKQQEFLLTQLLWSCLATAPGEIHSSRVDQGPSYEMRMLSGR